MPVIAYDRGASVGYAHTWAYRRNPRYYDFEHLGGDCTNFTSQCVYAGAGVMNYTPTFGWYYSSPDSRSPSWSGVPFFYDFMTTNRGTGPFGVLTSIYGIEPGDFLQLGTASGRFYHTPFIVSVGNPPMPQNILVATHSDDQDYYALSNYNGEYGMIRFVHIVGVRSQ